jgi:hypothetical protein
MQGSTPEHKRRTRAVIALASLGTQQVSVRTLLDAPRRRFHEQGTKPTTLNSSAHGHDVVRRVRGNANIP